MATFKRYTDTTTDLYDDVFKEPTIFERRKFRGGKVQTTFERNKKRKRR